MSNILLELSEEVKCPFCYEFFSDPRSLPGCMHTFCAPCLDIIVKDKTKKLLCPLCRLEVPGEYTKVDDFPKNRLLANIVDRLKQSSDLPPDTSPSAPPYIPDPVVEKTEKAEETMPPPVPQRPQSMAVYQLPYQQYPTAMQSYPPPQMPYSQTFQYPQQFASNPPQYQPNQVPYPPNQAPYPPNQAPYPPNQVPYQPNPAPYPPNPQYPPQSMPNVGSQDLLSGARTNLVANLMRMKQTLGLKRLYIETQMGITLIRNAQAACRIPINDQMIAIFDTSISGTATDCIVFGIFGIYYKNCSIAREPGNGVAFYWDIFSGKSIFHIAQDEVMFARGECIHIPSVLVPFSSFCKLLEAVKAAVGPVLHMLPRSTLPARQIPPQHAPKVQGVQGGQSVRNNEAILREITEGISAEQDLKEVPANSFYVHPTIDQKKLTTARTSCSVPSDETVFALVDCSFLGNCSHSVVFGFLGIYWNNGGWVSSPGGQYISYASIIRNMPFEQSKQICFGDSNNIINLGSSRFPPAHFVGLVKTCAQYFTRHLNLDSMSRC
eukprot:TRINITY_DN12613_c0_g1_i1.p1 TRINITY_DN12613_c0_g1~~TRINITY_DN12613_c0_g1_i1.p1  ORF type:complete len:549 (-),score=99.92 TRINITY_DN12613_c0_g1_i1:48-1694(-)